MKSLAARQKVHLLAALNNDHSSDLRACCAGVKSLSRPCFVPVRPLRPRSAAWRSLFVVNLSNSAPGRAPTAEVEACVVAGCSYVATTTLACNLIWRCNNYVLSCCISFFFVSPSLASKPMRRRLSLCSSCLGVSARVSTA